MIRTYKHSIFIFSLLIILFWVDAVFSQQNGVHGYVKDEISGESLIGATVFIPELKTGIVTNTYGYFFIPVLHQHDASLKVEVSYVGYEQNVFELKNDSVYLLYLKQKSTISEAVIVGDRSKKNSREPGILKLTPQEIKSIPSLTGEKDMLRAFQLLPGITSGKEGTSELHVRGGNADHNLFLVDGVPLYQVYHIGGFLSTFDADAVQKVELYKGSFPARYGGRLSSVIDVNLKEGNLRENNTLFSMGTLSSKFFHERSLKKDTSSLLISLRRCNIDLYTRLMSLIETNFEAMAGYTFNDAILKYNYAFSTKDRLFFSFYGGNDKIFLNLFDSNSESEFKQKYNNRMAWGNSLFVARWNHLYSSNLFSNVSLSYTKYKHITDYKIATYVRGSNEKIYDGSWFFKSTINDINLHTEFDYYLNAHKIKFGSKLIYHIYSQVADYKSDNGNSLSNTPNNFGEIILYAEDYLSPFRNADVNVGVHLNKPVIENSNYFSVQPRLIFKYLLTENISSKLSYSKMYQTMHMMPGTSSGMPIELWFPSSSDISPQESSQSDFGFTFILSRLHQVNLTIETYYKKMKALTDLKEGESFNINLTNWEDKIETEGEGKNYGLELLLKKEAGNLSGWFSYAYSRNLRKFSGISNGDYYPYRFERIHIVTAVVNLHLKENLSLSSVWTYGSGNPITLADHFYHVYFPDVRYGDVEATAHAYSNKNAYRLPAYHRMDLALNYSKQKIKGMATWSFGIYNVYNHHNPYFLYYKRLETGEIKLYSLSLFPIIPSVNYSFKFGHPKDKIR
ncbi:MAG: TonB-dependent receptor [Bacteroidota bacterium]